MYIEHHVGKVPKIWVHIKFLEDSLKLQIALLHIMAVSWALIRVFFIQHKTNTL